MRAVIGHNDQPTIITIRPPLPFPDEVLIKVHATALNRGDLLQVRGLYPQPAGAPETLGLELAGEIIGLGDNVSRWQIGDRVMALVAGGGYAEQAVVHQDHLMPIPAGFTYEQASAIPEAFLTAYSNMVQIGRLVAGERVLIHAGASGVGLSAIQIAKALGATVYTTVSAGKQAVCLEHGADQVIDYQTQNFADVILEQAPDGVNLVIDFIGAKYWDDNVRALAQWGRLVFIGLMGGMKHEVNFRQIMDKRLTISGSTLRNRTIQQKADLIHAFSAWGLPLFETGVLRPNVWKILPLDDVVEAHALMANNQNAGKIVLTV
jgi:putative PIG3 family NAD(P)H quinone oxidoreductase